MGVNCITAARIQIRGPLFGDSEFPDNEEAIGEFLKGDGHGDCELASSNGAQTLTQIL